MRERMAEPLARGQREVLARNLEQLAQMNPAPDKWRNWSRFASDGAQRARRGRDVELSCTRCHQTYRAEYNEKYRERPVPLQRAR